MRNVIPALLAAIVAFLPTTAWACAVCGGAGTPEQKAAFIGSTAFLSFLPLIAIGGGVLFIYMRYRKVRAKTPDLKLVADDASRG